MPIHTISFGPTVDGMARPVEQMLWCLLECNGRLARYGTLLKHSVTQEVVINLSKEKITKLEKEWQGKFVGWLIEPVFDHNGYYDPDGGFFYENELQLHRVKMQAKIGKLLEGFFECPNCATVHTNLTRSCRYCDYKLSS